jgi:predicted ATPase
MHTLESIRVRNFRSIADQTVDLRRLNLFIGGNGSGKSNLIGVFHFISRIAAQELQTYTGVMGGADKILHFGRKRSPELKIALRFGEGTLANGYNAVLVPTEDDRLIFSEERVWFQDRSEYQKPYDVRLGGGQLESRLEKQTGIEGHVRNDLRSYRIYHFHDTSPGARVKQTGDIDDNRLLQIDAGNLAAFLYRLKATAADHFRLIESTIRQIAPFFAGFDLEPSKLNPGKIRLQWREQGADALFGPEALSDGTLRFVCLAALFLQPEPPPVILIDEPELGLHPAAIVLLAAMLRTASVKSQVIVATQSTSLVNQFTPEDLCVVERREGGSVFRRLDATDLSQWLDDYGLGDLWEKNVLGGRP